MTPTISQISISGFLAQTALFEQLETNSLQTVAAKCQLVRYRIGQPLFVREKMPTHVAIIYEGQVRLLGYDQCRQMPVSLQVVGAGEILGWVGLVRRLSCEIAIASTEVICITIPAEDFFALMAAEPAFGQAVCDRCALSEVFELLSVELQRRAEGSANLKELALKAYEDTVVLNFPQGRVNVSQLDSNRVWLVSSGVVGDFSAGSRLPLNQSSQVWRVEGKQGARLLGLPNRVLDELNSQHLIPNNQFSLPNTQQFIPYAPNSPSDSPLDSLTPPPKYSYIRGRGPIDAPLACFQMLAQSLGVSFRRDLIRRVLENQLRTTGSISLSACGAIAELMQLKSQVVKVPAVAVSRLPTPAMLQWQDSFALLYKASETELVLAVPETGIRRLKRAAFIEAWGESGQVLLLQPTSATPQQRFGLSWFLPSLRRYRKVLLEVFIASFFVQLFGLANPLVTQVIIDKVLIQNSIDTLNILGIFLIVMALFEAVITGLRTNLFVDTTNRIDLALGAQVIDHLLRLPLRYFERRPVGELSTRVNELENIRSFLTGTALTVVLDAVFSVIYIAVMVFYSPLLTVVALATVPLFAVLTYIVAPIIRQQLRTKAERNAQTQSYLVEVVSGIQTVKAQNIELRSRWQWHDRYARYVSAGFKSVITSTTASSISSFLNKLSSLLLLWAGAYLVLQGKLTLGQLIAFRIIAGYTTSPLLRLIQLWQNFQETALSLERLACIIHERWQG